MQLAMIGLGRMGANMVRRLMGDGHPCVVHDAQAENVTALAGHWHRQDRDACPLPDSAAAKRSDR
jgi:6-phosphogluconate dehydrogenase (decarboxylating)